MNYHKKIITLSSLIAILSITLILGLFFLPHGIFARRVREVVNNFDQNQITKIEIVARRNSNTEGVIDDESNTITLVADNTRDLTNNGTESAEWHYLLGDIHIPAQQVRIQNLIEGVGALQRYRTITSNPAVYDELGFGVGHFAHMRLYNQQGELIVDIMQGNTDPQRGVYAKLHDDDNIYLISDDIVFYLEQSAGYWQHTSLFPDDISLGDVISIAVIADDVIFGEDEDSINAEYRLVRAFTDDNTAAEWQIENDDKSVILDNAQVDSLVSAALGLQADSFSALSAEQINISDNFSIRIDIELDNQDVYTIKAAMDIQRSARYFLTIEGAQALRTENGDNYLYNANEFSLRPIVKPLSALLPPPLSTEESINSPDTPQ